MSVLFIKLPESNTYEDSMIFGGGIYSLVLSFILIKEERRYDTNLTNIITYIRASGSLLVVTSH